MLAARQTSAVAPARAARAQVSVQCVRASQNTRRAQTARRHQRLRRKLSGTPERPRLAVFRTNEHIYAQVIDDVAGRTLAAASTLTPEIKAALATAAEGEEGGPSSTRSVAAAEAVGKKIAELCSSKGISAVAYDRGGFAYHGRIQALADAAREGGLQF